MIQHKLGQALLAAALALASAGAAGEIRIGQTSSLTGQVTAGIKAALDSFRRVDIGGPELSFSAPDHGGLDYADLARTGADGRFRR